MKRIGIIVLMAASFLIASCEGKPKNQQNQSQVSDSQIKESFEKVNRYMVNEEEEDIANYITRHQLNMVVTGRGVRYQIMQAGQGELIRLGQTVTMEYTLHNIMGDLIYSSEKDGVMRFVVGCTDVVSGLDEAMQHLHLGDVAKVIVPSHLGYGLLGDQKAIPACATLIYTIKITAVEN